MLEAKLYWGIGLYCNVNASESKKKRGGFISSVKPEQQSGS